MMWSYSNLSLLPHSTHLPPSRCQTYIFTFLGIGSLRGRGGLTDSGEDVVGCGGLMGFRVDRLSALDSFRYSLTVKSLFADWLGGVACLIFSMIAAQVPSV